MNPKTPVVCFQNVSFGYTSEIILQNVDLCIEAKEMVGIVGPNGGGKTTLLLLILGLLKPTSGSVKVFGNDPFYARKKIGYVPQHLNFDAQFPVTVMDIVLMGRINHQKWFRFSKKDLKLAADALTEVGLQHVKNQSFSSLSGGQRQRVLIARALSSNPELLLLDEATSNMDHVAMQKLYDLLKKLSNLRTILLVSHDIGITSNILTKIICVNKNAVLHHTDELTGEIIQKYYGQNMSLIRHDKPWNEEIHKCHPS